MSEQYVYYKNKRRVFADMSLEEQDDFFKDMEYKNKIKQSLKRKKFNVIDLSELTSKFNEKQCISLAKCMCMKDIQYNEFIIRLIFHDDVIIDKILKEMDV